MNDWWKINGKVNSIVTIILLLIHYYQKHGIHSYTSKIDFISIILAAVQKYFIYQCKQMKVCADRVYVGIISIALVVLRASILILDYNSI